MCGINGILGSADASIILTMNDALLHRGPDDAGVFIDTEANVSHPCARRSAENSGLVGGGQAPVGRGHASPRAVARGAAWIGAATGATWAGGESGRTLRNPAPAALVPNRDADGIRVHPGAVPLLRRLSWRRTVNGRPRALAALPSRCTDRDHDLARRAAAHSRG